MAIVVDTDLVSYIFKKDSRAVRFEPHMVQTTKFISFMTFAELRRWEFKSNWGQTKTSKFEMLLSEYGIIHSDDRLCNIWANVTNESNAKGRKISSADAWVAAVAMMFDIPLLTNNRKDFEHIAGLSIL